MAGGSFDNVAKVWSLPSYLYETNRENLELRVSVALGTRLTADALEAIPWQQWQDLRDQLNGK